MREKSIELRKRRNFSEIIGDFFDFIRMSIKTYAPAWLVYNGIFLLSFIICSYLMVTGMIGSIFSHTTGEFDDSSNLYIGFGIIFFVLTFVLAIIVNYSYASAFMIKYENEGHQLPEREEVWQMVKSNFGKLFVLVLIIIVVYLISFVANLILAFIPVIGFIASIVVSVTLTTWIGLGFVAVLDQNKGVTEALSDAAGILRRGYWKCIISNVIGNILMSLATFVIYIIPGIIVGVITFHIVDTSADYSNAPGLVILYTVALFLLIGVYAFVQTLAQFMNVILYYTIQEESYNYNMQSKIDQIGESPQP